MFAKFALPIVAVLALAAPFDAREALRAHLDGVRQPHEVMELLYDDPDGLARLTLEELPQLELPGKVRAFDVLGTVMGPRHIGAVEPKTIAACGLRTVDEIDAQLRETGDHNYLLRLTNTLRSIGIQGYPDETAERLIGTANYAVGVRKVDSAILSRLLSLVGYTHRPEALDVIVRVQNIYSFDTRDRFGDTDAWRYAPTWNALMASARLYQSSDVDAALAKIREAGWQTAVNELVYIRQPQVVDLLAEFLDPEDCEVEDDGTADVSISPPCLSAVAVLVQLYPALHDELAAIRDSGGFTNIMDPIDYVNAWLAVPGNRESLRDGLSEIEPPARPEADY